MNNRRIITKLCNVIKDQRQSRPLPTAMTHRQSVVQRVVPPGRLIVCTSIENWPEEAMLCMPDGYVRCRDVSFETSLFAPP